MKRIVILAAFIGIVLYSCNEKTANEMKNPLLTTFNTPYEVPPFEIIKPEHYLPAFEEGMKQHKDQIDAIVNNQDEPSFENTILALDNSGKLLGRVSEVFFGQSAANTSEELQKIEVEVSPKLTAHQDEISLNPKIFGKVKVLFEKKDDLNLDPVQMYMLENIYKGFIRSGANLEGQQKEELMTINQKLSGLVVQFTQNILAETNAFQLIIDNENDLAGLPQSVKDMGAATAKEMGMEGKWVYTTQIPSMTPFLQYADNRELRKQLHRAYFMRGNNNNENDNKKLLSEIVKLRVQQAQLLGYPSHSDLILETRMAKNPEGVYKLLNRLWDAALPVAQKEAMELQAIIDREGGDFKLESWDWWYYAEKLRKEKYDLDESELRPYFELSNVREGAFWVANQLYGLTFEEVNDIPKPHPDVQAFEVKDVDGSYLGLLYMDWHPRASKLAGAWCGGYRGQYYEDGKRIAPIVTTVFNFTNPTTDEPSLLSLDEIETTFHEFGHALDGLLADCPYRTTFVATDFVELPSQIMEHWAFEPEVLKHYAKHYKTGEVIPQELINKVENSGLFNQGFVTIEYLAAALLDMKYHSMTEAKDIDIDKFEKDYFAELGLIPEIVSRYRSTYFNHITGWGYSSAYYSYIWSGVLDADGFEAFKETSLFDQENAKKFRILLAKNGTKDPMKLYIDFRGREPKIDALLKKKGLK